MKFIKTNDGEYLAIDTVAKISCVEITYKELEPAPDNVPRKTPMFVNFKVITKRGEQYAAGLDVIDFNRLIKGN